MWSMIQSDGTQVGLELVMKVDISAFGVYRERGSIKVRHCCARSRLLVIFKHSHECLLRDFDVADHFHSAFAFFLFFEELAFS